MDIEEIRKILGEAEPVEKLRWFKVSAEYKKTKTIISITVPCLLSISISPILKFLSLQVQRATKNMPLPQNSILIYLIQV